MTSDSKSWLWRKKSSDKAIAAEREELTSRKHEKEIRELLAEKAQLQRDLHESDDKLSSALSECTSKDDVAKNHAKTAKEALAGWEKAEAKSSSLKVGLDEALKQREICEERARHLDSALKECMQQLRFVREDQEQRIHDVIQKSSEELEETKMYYEERLEESGENIAKLSVENSQLGQIISLKKQLIEDLGRQMRKAEENITSLLAKLASVEKDNNTLRYEVRVLEKEVDIRNEEKEFNRRSSDATQKQHLENVKKIAKLESECQRLRLLVRKKLPGPADLAKMKSEVNILQKKPNLNASLDYGVNNYSESPGKKINLLSDKILTLKDENQFLRENLQKNLNELQISRNMYLQTATKLSQVESQLEEFPKHHLMKEIRINRKLSYDLSLTSASDVGSDDKSVGVSDINHLMDDFADMEKLALVCVDKPTESVAKELVPVSGVFDSEVKNSKNALPSNLKMSISKLIEIIQGTNLPSDDNDNCTPDGSESPTNYHVRVFQWKTSELTVTLQNLLRTCDELLNGNTDVEKFAQELTSSFELMINHCLSPQDESIEKDVIMKQFGWESIIANLKEELEVLKSSKVDMEDEFENNAVMIEDLNVQLLAIKCEMYEAHQNLKVLEGELMSMGTHCDELEAKCLDLQAHLESVTKTDSSQHSDHANKKLETEWEISTASEKLAECQETILHLGKQIQAMSTSRNTKVSDKFMSTPTKDSSTAQTNVQNLTSERSSLFDKMQASDDDSGVDQHEQSPETKEIISAQDYISAKEPMAIVPYKKQQIPTSGGLFKKLLWRKKKNHSKMMQFPFDA